MSRIGRMMRGLTVGATVIGALAIGAAQAVASERTVATERSRSFCVQEECERYCVDTWGPGAIGDCVVGECVCEY